MNNAHVIKEDAIQFTVDDATLYGIVSTPDDAKITSYRRGVLFLVGGPQYRVGSHRQFTLLARDLAQHGYCAMRFDYQGMGDSEGAARHFLACEKEIRAAVDHFFQIQPDLHDVVLWGLCDAASAAMCYASQDTRVSGLLLVNPWVRTETGIAKTYLKHYYVARLLDGALWKKIVRGEFDFAAAASSFLQQLRQVVQVKKEARNENDQLPLPDQMRHGLRQFTGRTCIILCGNDLTAREFSDLVSSDTSWRQTLASPAFTRHDLPEANHTFSQRRWREQVARWTLEWLK